MTTLPPPYLPLQHPKDTEKAVEKRLEEYSTYVDDLTDYYSAAQHVNADQDPYTIQEIVESVIVNPLPKLSHQPASE